MGISLFNKKEKRKQKEQKAQRNKWEPSSLSQCAIAFPSLTSPGLLPSFP